MVAFALSSVVRNDVVSLIVITTEKHYLLEDIYGTAGCFFSVLAESCAETNHDVYLARLPMNNRIAAAVIPALSLSLTVTGEHALDKTIHMSRFLKKEPPAGEKGRLRLANKCMTSLLEDCVNSFKEAGKAHFALEGIYASAMDFPSLNKYTDRIRTDIQRRLADS